MASHDFPARPLAFAQILPVLVVSPLYFAGSIELGVVTQSSAFHHVLSDLSILITEFEARRDHRRDIRSGDPSARAL